MRLTSDRAVLSRARTSDLRRLARWAGFHSRMVGRVDLIEWLARALGQTQGAA